jgi:hypothetical protein
MPFQLRLVRQNAVQTAVQARVVDLAVFDFQQIIQRGGRIPALLDSQFAARRAQTIDRQQRRHARPWHVGGFAIDGLLEEAIQFETLPHFQSEEAGAELPRPLQTYFVQQHPRYLRLVRRRLHMRGQELQLLAFTLFIEDLNGCQPARLRGAVQLAQVAQSLLTWTIRRAYGFHQRPIGVVLAVLLATVRPQKHSELIVSWYRFAFKTVGLHYIAVWELAP